MLIAYICGRLPWPARSGGQRDTFNRAQAMRRLGHEVIVIAIINSGEKAPLSADVAVVEKEIGRVIFAEADRSISSKLNKILNIWRSPLLAVRISSSSTDKVLFNLVEDNIDVVWLDYLFAHEFAFRISNERGVVLALRSHNIEHRYRRAVSSAANSLKTKVMSYLRSLSVARFELAAARSVDAILDISFRDVDFWQQEVPRCYVAWLPPIFDFLKVSQKIPSDYDAAFLGSLATPTNLEGLYWYFNFVHRIILEEKPSYRLLIGGSKPNAAFIEYIRHMPGADIKIDVADPTEIWSAGQILINPVLSGEGVNIKSVEMLGYDKPLITTKVGVRGFPEAVQNAFIVADRAEDFARAILTSLETQRSYNHDLARSQFDSKILGNILVDIAKIKVMPRFTDQNS